MRDRRKDRQKINERNARQKIEQEFKRQEMWSVKEFHRVGRRVKGKVGVRGER